MADTTEITSNDIQRLADVSAMSPDEWRSMSDEQIKAVQARLQPTLAEFIRQVEMVAPSLGGMTLEELRGTIEVKDARWGDDMSREREQMLAP